MYVYNNNIEQNKIWLLSVYISSSGNIITFIANISTIITNIVNSYKHITLILIGDININLFNTTNSKTIYLDLLNYFNFNQYINFIIFDLCTTVVSINIFIRDNYNYYAINTAFINFLIITDHYLLFLQISRYTMVNQNISIKKKPYKYIYKYKKINN